MAITRSLGGAINGADPFAYCNHNPSSYSNRTLDPDHYNWCIVPDSGYDGILFATMAVSVAIFATGKFSALLMLVAGGACGAISIPFNLGRFSNGIAIWLGIEPADLFLYIFLPPLLLDSAIRVDPYIFKKVRLMIMSLAFLLVAGSTLGMIPIMLYVFNLRAQKWQWQHAALFSAMIASTDAVAVSAILKKGGGPESWVVLMEGESLFNDATSIVLFEIFLDLVRGLNEGKHESLSLFAQLSEILTKIVWLAGGGAVIGYLAGWVERQLMKLLRFRGDTPAEELALSVATAYFIFYIANGPGGVSGVIAVVVFGLYGGSTSKWSMSPAVVENGIFFHFYDTLAFAMNGIVFFFAGASSVNFFYRSTEHLVEEEGAVSALLDMFGLLPLVYLAMLVLRFCGIYALVPLFRAFGTKPEMTFGSVVFATFGGLRGALSLVMVQMVVGGQADFGPTDRAITAQIALWTAGVVLCTLLVNAPLMPWLLKKTGLLAKPSGKLFARGKAARALLRYSEAAVSDLQNDEDELLSGVDWDGVRKFTDLSVDLQEYAGLAQQPTEAAPLGSTRKNRLDPYTAVHGTRPGTFTFLRAESKLDAPLLQNEVSPTTFSSRVEEPQRTVLNSILEPVLSGESAGSLENAGPSLDQLAAARDARAVKFSEAASCMFDVPLLFHTESGGKDPSSDRSPNRQEDGRSGENGSAEPACRVTGPSTTSADYTTSMQTREGNRPGSQGTPTISEDIEAQGSGPLPQSFPAGDENRTGFGEVLYRNISTIATSHHGSPDAVTRSRAELRQRLVMGMKRYQHSKRAEGLLSGRGLALLDNACNAAIDEPHKPLAIFGLLQHEVSGRWSHRIAVALFHLRRIALDAEALGQTRGGLTGFWLKVVVASPLNFLTGCIGDRLSKRMMLGIEVVISYWLALHWSPTAQIISKSETRGLEPLRAEIRQETKRALKFIVDREIEAPARFQAIQTYRATMAVLHQQQKFIEELLDCGMVDEAELEAFNHPVDKRIRDMFYRGPSWKAVKYRDTLRTLPFLQNLTEATFHNVLDAGQLLTFPPNSQIWPLQNNRAGSADDSPNAPGFYVVVAGLVHLEQGGEGNMARPVLLVCVGQVRYLGTGGLIGIIAAVTEQADPYHLKAKGVANGLKQGPVLFYFPRALLLSMSAAGAAGDPELRQLELDLYRVAAFLVVERSRNTFVDKVAAWYDKLAASRGTRRVTRNVSSSAVNQGTGFLARSVSANQRAAVRESALGDLDDDSGQQIQLPELLIDGHAGANEVLNSNAASMLGGADTEQRWLRIQRLVKEGISDIRSGLEDAELVRLAPGQIYEQKSHVIILRGAVQWQSSGKDVVSSTVMTISGPCLLPWLGHVGQLGGLEKTEAVKLVGKGQPVILLACHAASA